MRIIAIDGGAEKGELCKKLGAEEYIDFTSTKDIAAEVTRITTYGAHGVLVTAATAEAYASAPNLLRPGGTVVAVGLPKDPSVIAGAPPILLCLKRLNVVGSKLLFPDNDLIAIMTNTLCRGPEARLIRFTGVTGTLKDVEEALSFTARGLVHPILTKGTLDDVDKYCELMIAGKLPGRAVLKVS
jgi:alcohol dehydrogenase, propanol-preferring